MGNIIIPLPKPSPKYQKPTVVCCFKDFIGKSDEEIYTFFEGNVILLGYIENFDFLLKNLDLIKKILDILKERKSVIELYSCDYRVLKYFEEFFDDSYNFNLKLKDDYENKDRSYINTEEFTKFPLEIPFFYPFWGTKIKENGEVEVSTYTSPETLAPGVTRYQKLTLDQIRKIKELIIRLRRKYGDLTDLEKTIIISDYIQDLVQYVDTGNISKASGYTYFTDSKGLVITDSMPNDPYNLLFNHFGVCGGISQATVMLLNNPEFNLNIRGVFGDVHFWNVVLIDGKYYYLDNTWSVTRNSDRWPESLKARSFTSDYLLFGTKTANIIGNHGKNFLSYVPLIEEEDFPRSEIDLAQKRLSKSGICKFRGYNKPVFESKSKVS